MSDKKSYLRRLLQDDSGEPDLKSHISFTTLVCLVILSIGHLFGLEYQQFVFWGIIGTTLSAAGIQAFGRAAMKKWTGKKKQQ